MSEEDWLLDQHLDALSELLRGGIGAITAGKPTIIRWDNIDASREALGKEATAQYYLSKFDNTPHVFGTPWIDQQLQALEAGEGKTYFELILDIIAEHPHIKLLTN
ncbi:hypothetical protein FLA_2995 [Filimonas lacunae]|nr:hypothetical protein FLA_2995 [Filimonas lacunae]